ncbi:hypothetical protein C8Q78DRAFT_696170 [Trametes maxima]|nr:hypothetical protein C8Q78DRAFT_696170 [Trametes maxima]
MCSRIQKIDTQLNSAMLPPPPRLTCFCFGELEVLTACPTASSGYRLPQSIRNGARWALRKIYPQVI